MARLGACKPFPMRVRTRMELREGEGFKIGQNMAWHSNQLQHQRMERPLFSDDDCSAVLQRGAQRHSDPAAELSLGELLLDTQH